MNITRRSAAIGLAVLPTLRFTTAHAQTGVSPAEARQIAEDAYIYGYSLIINGTWMPPAVVKVS